VFEEIVIWTRRREFVTDERFLSELKHKGFEPQIVGEIDPPPKSGASWVLRDKRDRRAHEDGGVWISWSRPRGSEGRDGFSVKYVVETFDGRSGWDWYLSCAAAAAIARIAGGKVSIDRAADRDAQAFLADAARDPSMDFRGPESVVDWEARHLDEDGESLEDDDEEEDDETYEDEDLADEDEDDEDEDEEDEDDEDDESE